MLRALQERESGAAALEGAAPFSHRPHRVAAAALGDAGLARRLAQTAALTGHSGAVNALVWTESGELLASGGEDCRLRLWRGGTGELLHSIDTGHTSNVLSAAFLPGSHGDQLICCSADRQIRHLNVTKGAVRPYLVHSAPVRSVVALDPHLFLSASEDGTVREFDVRQRPAAVHREALACDDSNVLVDQRGERVGRARLRVGIYSLAVDPHRPWLMLTGGADPLLRLYDQRMLPGAGAALGGGEPAGSRARAPKWVSAYAPSHIKAGVWDAGRHPALAAPSAPAPAGRHVTAVAFARGGSEVVGSYAGELIYAFDVAQHARDVEALLHIPDSVLRAPARPRSHVGRRSVQAFAASQEQHVQSADAPAARGVTAAAAADAAVEGGGATAPAAAVGRFAQPGQTQQWQRAAAARGIVIAPSVRQLALQQRRQHSRVAAAAEAGDAPRAESSRPAHWQLRPTSSTLRSPLNEPRRHPHHLTHHEQLLLMQTLEGGSQLHLHEQGSESEGMSEGVSPEGHPRQRQGVRRSRRIMRRRRDAADQHQLHEDEDAEGEGEQQQEGEAHDGEVQQQQPVVSGVAEAAAGPASSSDSEDPGMLSPATRRRARRRTLPGSAGADNAAGAAAAGHGAGAAAAAADAVGSGGGFKAPPGRHLSHPQRQVAAAPKALQRLDSTVGLLQHHPPQQDLSEVAAGGGAAEPQPEVTVSQRPLAAGGRRGAPERSPAVEVSSLPVLCASQVGLGTQLGSLQAGHEASSLNSAEQPGHERVGSVAQRGRADAPSVGNVPLGTTAAAAMPAGVGRQQGHAQQQAAAEAREASTGHWRPPGERIVPPPPQFGADARPAHQQPGGARQRHQLQPTASTGTSRPHLGAHHHRQQPYLPPAASGRMASRLRRHSALDEPPLADVTGAAAAAAAEDGLAACIGSQTISPVAADGAQQQQARPASAQNAPSLLHPQPQATMLSGRGPSVLGDFMPGQQEQRGDSEIQQQQSPGAVGGAQLGGSGAAQQAHAQLEQQGERQQPQPRRRTVDSNVGAIVHGGDPEGEEVSEPTMYRCCYAGHLNLSGLAAGRDALPLAPQIAFLGAHTELLVSPSDDGNVFVWDYASGRLVAVLPPAAAGPTWSAAAAAHGHSPPELAPAAAGATCVAPHPLLPELASGGADAVVRLWSPQAQQQCSAQTAVEAAQANLQRLAEAGLQPGSSGPADGLLLGGEGGGRRRGRPIDWGDCHTM